MSRPGAGAVSGAGVPTFGRDGHERLGAAADGEVVGLVERHVRPLIAWYDGKKRWPRRLHRATTVAVILLGAGIPLLSINEPPEGFRWLTPAAGVTISALTGLATVTDWQRRWQVFTTAQTALEARLADWEMAMTEASLAPPERARQMRVEATRDLLAAALRTRQSETEEFFAGQAPAGATATSRILQGAMP
jgi:hypothetical protein